MLTAEENDRLTQVGPETPMGNLFRRYWQPIATSSQLDENPVRPVRLFGESLTLFRDRRGRLGLVADRCAHRHVRLMYGIPEEDGLRCCYHGWLYDRTGQCIEQPAEPADSRFKDKIRVTAYPVQELAGAIFAYLGPEPAPLLPRWDRLAWDDNVMRQIIMCELPCNWLQVVENYMDFAHAQWLHGPYNQYVLQSMGVPPDDPRWLEANMRTIKPQRKLGYDFYEHGIVCRILLDGETEDNELWSVGHPMVFPNSLSIAGGGYISFAWAVPIDDTHTMTFSVQTYVFDKRFQAPTQESVPYFKYPYDLKREDGTYALDVISVQDNLVFETQGAIANRTVERLGDSDRGILMHRQLLRQQMDIVEDGGEPMNVFRDPEKNRILPLPAVKKYYERGRTDGGLYRKGAVTASFITSYSPFASQIEELLEAEAAAKALPV